MIKQVMDKGIWLQQPLCLVLMYRQSFFSPTSLLKNTRVNNCVNISDEKGKHSNIFYGNLNLHY